MVYEMYFFFIKKMALQYLIMHHLGVSFPEIILQSNYINHYKCLYVLSGV